jgi:hypothetical protein
LTLASLRSDNTLVMCVDLYRWANRSSSIIIREFCEAIKNHVRPLVFKKATLACIRKFAFDLKNLPGIPYVLKAIGRSHTRVVHLVHFNNDMHHNIGWIEFIWHKIYKRIPNNEGSSKSKLFHYK